MYGKVYISDNTIIYEDLEGVVKITPSDPTRVRFLYEFYVEQFKEMEKFESQLKILKRKLNTLD